MKLYCNNCGRRIDSEDLFCSGCGKRIKNKPDTENSESETGVTGPETSISSASDSEKTAVSFLKFHKIPFQKYFFHGIRIVALIYIIGVLPIIFSTFALVSGKSPDTDKNIRLCEEIADDYCNSHTYSKNDVYDCDNMAQDIWNMLKAKGINARIAVGYIESANDNIIVSESVNKDSDSETLGQIEIPSHTYEAENLLNSSVIDNFNHAWVLAEVSPDSWLAIECTAGYTVYMDENENYYQGLTFSNPKNYRSFLSLYDDWKAKSLEYENERLYYNELVRSYNNASSSKQDSMESGIKVAQRDLNEKEKAFLITDSELNALLKYG